MPSDITSPVEKPPSSKQGAFEQARAAMNGVMKRSGSTNIAPIKGISKKKKAGGKAGGSRAAILIPLLDNTEQEVSEMVNEVLRDVTVSTIVYFGDSANMNSFSDNARPNVTAKALAEVGGMEMISLDVGLVVVVGPTPDQLAALRTLSQRAGQCPVLLLNAEWDPDNVPAGQQQLVDSFEVVYWHQPLAIEGFMKNTAGAVFKFAPSGIAADESWYVFWDSKQVFSNATRPTPIQLEQVLYQKAAENSKLVQAAKVVAAAREKVFGGFGKKK